MGRLTVLRVKSAGPGRHGDGDGLYLLVKATGARSWVLRVQRDGKRQDIGLGSVDLAARTSDEARPSDAISLLLQRHLTLQTAREKANELRRFAKAGHDPIAERDKDRRSVPAFCKAAEECHGDLKSAWSRRQQDTFLSSLKRHAFPTLGNRRVDQIDASHIRDMLAPIWTDIPDMARKVRQRVLTVLNFAHSKGWRPTEAPGRSVAMGLGKQQAGSNYAAMPYQDLPAFIAEQTSKADTVGRLALIFTIYTASRSGEVRQARWSQINRDKKLWNRPASIMKSKLPHAVTLSDAAIAILDRAAALGTVKADGLIFASAKGTALSDMTLSKVMRDAKLPFTVHGFRSSFRDFAAEQMSTIPDAVAEAALAHVVPDKVERAYKRTSFLEMRRHLLDAWGSYLTRAPKVAKLAAVA